jgi:Ubiquitin elongating factor core
MLQWLFASVEMNAERAKSYPDYRVAASDGFFMNLAAVCIKLCQPFIQPSAKTWARIDARCGSLSTLMNSIYSGIPVGGCNVGSL